MSQTVLNFYVERYPCPAQTQIDPKHGIRMAPSIYSHSLISASVWLRDKEGGVLVRENFSGFLAFRIEQQVY